MLLVYIIALCILIALYILHESALSFAMLIMFLALPAVFFPILLLNVRKLKVELSQPEKYIRRKKKLRCKIIINNPVPIPISNFYATVYYRMSGDMNFEKRSITVPVRADASEKVVIEITAPHCGIAEFVLKKWSVYDLTNLTWIKRKMPVNIKTAVLPMKAVIDDELAAALLYEDESSHSAAVGETGSDVDFMREYREGDRLNMVHWKLSCRTDELVVKELERISDKQIIIIPDMSACKTPEELDKMFDVYNAAAELFLEADITPGIVCDNGDEDIDIQKASDIAALREVLISQLSSPLMHIRNADTITERFAEKYECGGFGAKVFSHIVIVTPEKKSATPLMLEQCGAADRITVICTSGGNDNGEYEFSNIMVFYR